MTHDFAGKVAFVTGAGSGLGLAAARAFALAGAKVALTDVNEASVSNAAADLRAEGRRCACPAAGCFVEADVQQAVRATVEKFGSLDAAFNNAVCSLKQPKPPTLWARISTV